MATRRYKINSGDTEFKIVEEVGIPTVSHNMEFTIDLAAVEDNFGGTRVLYKEEVMRALEMIKNHILSGKLWPPA